MAAAVWEWLWAHGKIGNCKRAPVWSGKGEALLLGMGRFMQRKQCYEQFIRQVLEESTPQQGGWTRGRDALRRRGQTYAQGGGTGSYACRSAAVVRGVL